MLKAGKSAKNGRSSLKSSFTVINSINIQNDSDFQRLAAMHGWPGNGSETNPYVIENVEINGSIFTNDDYKDYGLITINNTRVYFIIRNCFLRDFNFQRGAGILLQNATNGQVYNCEITNIAGTYGSGIRTFNVTNMSFYNNTIHGNAETAFDIQSFSQLVTVENNTIYNNGIGVQVGGFSSNIIVSGNVIHNTTYQYGIALFSTDAVTVANNEVTNSYLEGIALDHANNSIISGNMVSNSGFAIGSDYSGIWVRYSSYNVIKDNFIFNNTGYGILLESVFDHRIEGNAIHANANSGISVGTGSLYATNPPSTWTNITGNVITGHPLYGVELWNAENTTVMKNNFIQNALSQEAQFFESYYLHPSLNMSYNYWDELTSPDTNFDGIVDIPYVGQSFIGLDANISDPYPVTMPYNITVPLHFLLPPRLVYPNINVYSVNGTIIVSWRPAFDSKYHLVNYNLSLSSDYGLTWSSVATGLTNNSYALDTTLYPDGTSYQLKVVAFDGLGLVAENVSWSFSIENGGSGGGSHTLTVPEILYPTVGAVINGTITVSWNASIDSLGHAVTYTLFYSDDGGTNWNVLAANLTMTSYWWNTTIYPNGDQYTLMVVADDGFGLTEVYVLPGTFTINNVPHSLSDVFFIYPVGGETLNGTVTVSWSSSSDSWGHVVYYSLYYSPDNGTSWHSLINDTTSTMYTWDTTTVPNGTQYLLKVIARDLYGLSSYGVTPTVFTINNTQGGSTTSHELTSPAFIYPTGGETLSGTVEIKWNGSVDSLGHSVYYSLYYTPDNGTTWTALVVNTTTTSFLWDTTTVLNGTYKLKLVATDFHGLQVEIVSGTFVIDNVSGGTSTTAPPSNTTTVPTTSANATAGNNQTSSTQPPVTVQTPFVSVPFVVMVLSLVAVMVKLRPRKKT